jgi:hypothetical protein
MAVAGHYCVHEMKPLSLNGKPSTTDAINGPCLATYLFLLVAIRADTISRLASSTPQLTERQTKSRRASSRDVTTADVPRCALSCYQRGALPRITAFLSFCVGRCLLHVKRCTFTEPRHDVHRSPAITGYPQLGRASTKWVVRLSNSQQVGTMTMMLACSRSLGHALRTHKRRRIHMQHN